MRSAVIIGSIAIAMSQSHPALAEETFVRNEPGRRVTLTRDWYGDSVLLVYGVAYGAGSLGYVLRLEEHALTQAVGIVFLSGGVVTALVGAPIVHWSNDEVGRGFVSFGGQIGSALIGTGIGVGIRETGDSEFHDAAPLIGAVVGHATFALIDALALARRERVVSWESTQARRPTPVRLGPISPGLQLKDDGLIVTLSAPVF